MRKKVMLSIMAILFLASFIAADQAGMKAGDKLVMKGHDHGAMAEQGGMDKCPLCGVTGDVKAKNTKDGAQINITAKEKDRIKEIQARVQEWLKWRERAAARAPADKTAEAAAVIESKMDGNPEDIVYCPVMGTKMKKKNAYAVYEHKGKKYYLCCGMCVVPFTTEPEKYLKK